MEGNALASAPPSTPIDVACPTPISHRKILDARPWPSATSRGRPGKGHMTFSHKRGRGH